MQLGRVVPYLEKGKDRGTAALLRVRLEGVVDVAGLGHSRYVGSYNLPVDWALRWDLTICCLCCMGRSSDQADLKTALDTWDSLSVLSCWESSVRWPAN
jgi:hypothetical protein